MRLCAALLTVFVLVSCGSGSGVEPESGPGPVILSAMAEKTSFGAKGGSLKVTVVSNMSWTVSAGDAAEWLKPWELSGNGNGVVTINVEPNEGDERWGVISISTGKLTETISITQSAPAIRLPGAAGKISGENAILPGGAIVLSIGRVERAITYKWYKDGEEVQHGYSLTLDVTETGTYKVAGVNDLGEGEASPDKVVSLVGLPGAAGVIEGGSIFTFDKPLHLTIGEIERAVTYRWYWNGAEVCNTAFRTLPIIGEGEYKVAGVNELGEGEHSPGKFVMVAGGVAFAAGEGTCMGDYLGLGEELFEMKLFNNAGITEQTGIRLLMFSDKPANPDNTGVAAGTYRVVWADDNGGVYNGTVLPGYYTDSGVQYNNSYYYHLENGRYVDEDSRFFTDGMVIVERSGDSYTIAGRLECRDMNGYDATNFQFNFRGDINFGDNVEFIYDGATLPSSLDLGEMEGSSDFSYYGNLYSAGDHWTVELWNHADPALSGNDIVLHLNTPKGDGGSFPDGVYAIATVPREGKPGTADRGYFYDGRAYGTQCKAWNGNSYTASVFAAPDNKSYVKVTARGGGVYSFDVDICDRLGSRVTCTYTGAVGISDKSGSGALSHGLPNPLTAARTGLSAYRP